MKVHKALRQPISSIGQSRSVPVVSSLLSDGKEDFVQDLMEEYDEVSHVSYFLAITLEILIVCQQSQIFLYLRFLN